METARVIQLAGLILCLVLILSELCYSYPSNYYTSSDEENAEQGIREMLEDLERQGLVHSLLANNKAAYHPSRGIGNGHEIMTRKVPRSGSNSNLRLRYGKRSLPVSAYGFMNIAGGDGTENLKGRVASGGSIVGGPYGKTGNWKVGGTNDLHEQE